MYANGPVVVKALHDLTIVNDTQHYIRLNRVLMFASDAERRFPERTLSIGIVSTISFLQTFGVTCLASSALNEAGLSVVETAEGVFPLFQFWTILVIRG